jgi:hypothetical protein
MPESDPIMERLEDQLQWYDRKSLLNQRIFKRIKITEIVGAAIIPFLAALNVKEFGWSHWVTGGVGVLITVLEGLLQLGQYQHNWITYRSTAEALKHEKYLYLGKAAAYAGAADPHALLAERVEMLVSQEHKNWDLAQQTQAKPRAT